MPHEEFGFNAPRKASRTIALLIAFGLMAYCSIGCALGAFQRSAGSRSRQIYFPVAAVAIDAETTQPIEGALCVDGGFTVTTNVAGYGLFASWLLEGRRQISCTKPWYDLGFTIYENNNRPDETTGYPNVRVTLRRTIPPLPPVPSRTELLTAPLTFQGLTLHCDEFGDTPVFDVMIDVLSPTCRQHFYAMKRAAGDKVIAVAVSHAYLESNIPAPISTGHDWSYDLRGLASLLDEIVRAGFYVQLHLAGDGSSSSKLADGSWRYNDPVGWTYGQPWLMETFPAIASALAEYDGYIRYVIGFDGVFYGWSPEQVVAFGDLFRSLKPNGVLGIEHDIGHIPLGEGGSDYQSGGRMRAFDFVLGEYPADLHGDAVWQILGRMVRPYTRPHEQPDGDDPSPPFYFIDVDRGPRVYNCFEWNLYDWVRRRVLAEQLARDRATLRALGCTVVG